MPFALVTIGLLMIVTGAKDTYKEFGEQLRSDFTGENNFLYWLASIGAIGAIGYVEPLKPLSRAFMALIIIVMIVKNQGLFDKLQEAIKSFDNPDGESGTGKERTFLDLGNILDRGVPATRGKF